MASKSEMDQWPVANADRFTGFARTYDQYRPQPPAALVELLSQLAGTDEPALVVDLGCGTGLSTRIWAGAAQQVIGVEPSDDMRRQAQEATTAGNVSYRPGLSHETGLAGGCADIVTCAQSLHWMEPKGTFGEVRRILRPGGVFAAYDHDWPPTTAFWEMDAVWEDLRRRTIELDREHGVSADVKRWPKPEHLERMRASGMFRITKETLLHQVIRGDADRLVGLARSQASISGLLKHGLTEADIGLDRFRTAANDALGDVPHPWHFSYRLRLGTI